MCERHREAAGAELTPKLLTEQVDDIGLVVHNEDEDAHAGVSARLADELDSTPLRGSTIVNSVNCPASVATSIVPPCCFTMMSWLRERPRPVPSPAGFVVKNGSNILARTLSGIPLPLSRTRISTLSPRSRVATKRVGS